MTTHLEPVTFGERALRIEDVLALANRQAPTQLQGDAAYRQRIAKGYWLKMRRHRFSRKGKS